MKLREILLQPKGSTHVWMFTRESNVLENATIASRRVQACITQPKLKKLGVKVSTQSSVLVNTANCTSEPALVITIK